MSYIAHNLLGATVTWKESYDSCGNRGPFDWPFGDDVPQAEVVAVYENTKFGVYMFLVLKAPNGDLAEFVLEGARIVERE